MKSFNMILTIRLSGRVEGNTVKLLRWLEEAREACGRANQPGSHM